MVAFRYERWDEDLLRQLKQLSDLTEFFKHLILQANGDVDAALKYMERLQEMGYIDRTANLSRFRKSLEKQNIIDDSGQNPKLTRQGERMLRKEALDRIFSGLKRGAAGNHRTSHGGEGGERIPETRPYVFGEDLSGLDIQRTMHNALLRTGADLKLAQEDFEVSETEHLTSCATVLLLDISHSMILYGEDRITPAKKVAMAMAELIRSKYPKDDLHVCLFGDDAVEVPLERIPYVGAGPYHTNTRAALQLGQRILRRKKHPNKQIFMITDGKPSAIHEGGKLYKNPFGLDPRIVNLTLKEAASCRRNKIVITTFMLTDAPALVDFVNRVTRINKGRAYFSSVENLDQSIFVDYLRNRRSRLVR